MTEPEQFDDLRPRYSMKRMRDEIAKARKAAIEECITVADACDDVVLAVEAIRALAEDKP